MGDAVELGEYVEIEEENDNEEYEKSEPVLQKVDYLSDDGEIKEDVRCLWTRNATLELIELFKEYAPLVGKSTKFKNFKDVWSCICQRLQEKGFFFTPEQVGNKWKVLRRTYKNSIDKKRRHTSIYLNDLDPILRDEIKPAKQSAPNSHTQDDIVMEALQFVDSQNPGSSGWNDSQDPNYQSVSSSHNPATALMLLKNQMQQQHREKLALLKERNGLLAERNRIRMAELALEREKEQHRHEEKTSLLNILREYVANH